VVNPVNAIYRTSINGLLKHGLGIPILPHYPGTAIVRLNIEGISGNVGTVLAADTGDLVHINGFLAQDTP